MSDVIIKTFTNIEGLPGDEIDVDKPEEEMSVTSRFKLKADFFQTDTSEVEDLYDSAGADTTANKPTLIAPTFFDPEATHPEELEGGQYYDISSVIAKARLPKDTSTLTVPGRVLLKKYFSEAPPVRLPIGHRTLALSEPQLHTLLKVISDEAVATSLRTVQTLVSDTLKAGGRLYSGGLIPRGANTVRSISESSVDEPSRGGHTTDEYTSRALSSDDEFFARQVRPPLASTSDPPLTTAPNRPEELALSPGFTASDYQPLSQLRPAPEGPSTSRRTRKRRRLTGSTGKVMKEAYFKGIKWTRTFVTGPLDPEHNRHKFYCQLCKSNISIFSKGAREIIRHYQSESHLRKDQRWRFEHLRSVDKVTGQLRHEFRGRDGHILTALELEKEKPLFENAVLVDIGDKHPFYDDYMAGVTSSSSFEEIRLCTQISLIGYFGPRGGDVLVLQSLWNQVCVAANHKEPFLHLTGGRLR